MHKSTVFAYTKFALGDDNLKPKDGSRFSKDKYAHMMTHGRNSVQAVLPISYDRAVVLG